MKNEEQASYLMMFCALLLVRNSRATVEQSMSIVPLAGKAQYLARELSSAAHPWATAAASG